MMIKNVALFDPDSPDGLRRNICIDIEDGRITHIGPGYAPPEDQVTVIDGHGFLAAPGLVNAHTHSQSSLLAGFGDKLSHPAFMWRTQAFTSNRTPDEIRLSVLLAAYGALSSGTTAVIDHFPGQRFSAQDMEAVLSAWEETGLRVVLAARFFDAEFSDILPAKDGPIMSDHALDLLKPQPLASFKDVFSSALSRWNGAGEGRITLFPAPSNPDRCTDEALKYCADIASAYDLGIHTHLLETSRQRTIAQQKFNCSSVARLARLGILSDRWSCAHSVWLDEDDAKLMAEAGAIAVLNPESNARLGVGLAAIPMLERQGVHLALGTDGCGSNDNMAMHEAMRAIATAHRAGQADRKLWMTARQAFTIATEGGARAMRRPDIGHLSQGASADIVLYRMTAPWWMPVNDAVSQMVFAETGASVDTVIVGGEILWRGGRSTRFDVDSLSIEINEMMTSLRRRNADLFELADTVARGL